jgi:hypothetical protein
MNNLILFLASFILTSLLGLQQLNVEHRKYLYAFITSIFISAANYFLFKILPTEGFEFLQFLSFSIGGGLGIIYSMKLHDTLLPKSTKKLPPHW